MVLEPDFLGYMQQHSGLAPSAITTADGSLVDTVKRINAQVRANGGNVACGWQLNLWASPTGTGARGVSAAPTTTTRADGRPADHRARRQRDRRLRRVAGILTSGADFVSIDKYGLDAGIQSPDDPASRPGFGTATIGTLLAVRQNPGPGPGQAHGAVAAARGARQRHLAGQRAHGQAFPDLANTSQHDEDSCAPFFLGDTITEATSLRAAYFAQNKAGDAALSASGLTVTWGEHLSALPAHGVIAALFGAGVGDSTHGTGQPPTDGWYWIQSVQEYYLANPTPASAGLALPFLPLLLQNQ